MKRFDWFGPAYPELGWVPAPRYLLRRDRIRRWFSDQSPGALLEVGPGAGAFLVEWSRKGFECTALEASLPARSMMEAVFAQEGLDVPVFPSPQEAWKEAFDYLSAFDVLEHIEDDGKAVGQWASWIKPGGCLVLSVPARMDLWTEGDEWAGHFRRYEAAGLKRLLQAHGLMVERFECYGFPLSNVTEKVSARAYREQTHRVGELSSNRQKNNDRSGIDRRSHMKLFRLLKSPLGRLAMWGFLRAQSMFLTKDWGSGYVVVARKKESAPQ